MGAGYRLTMSQSAAGTLASVLPLVLVALALEGGRLHPRIARHRWFQRIWLLGIASSLMGTTIAVIGTQVTLVLLAGVVLDVIAGIAGASALAFLLAIVATAQAAAEKAETGGD
jgi:hypothetical protein